MGSRELQERGGGKDTLLVGGKLSLSKVKDKFLRMRKKGENISGKGFRECNQRVVRGRGGVQQVTTSSMNLWSKQTPGGGGILDKKRHGIVWREGAKKIPPFLSEQEKERN